MPLSVAILAIGSATAQEPLPNVNADTADLESEQVGQWQFAVGIGIGQKQSVVYDQNDRDLYLLPSIKYYGEHLFFDNGTLGYTLYENHDHAFSLVAELNPLLAQFKQFHPDNILNPTSVSSEINSPFIDNNTDDAVSSPTVEEDQSDVVDGGSSADQSRDEPAGPEQRLQDVKLQRLDWSIDVGVQHNWFISANLMLSTQVFHDSVDLHNGARVASTLSYNLSPLTTKTEIDNWQFTLEAGVHYLDKSTTQYYYGIDSRDTEKADVYFEVEAAMNQHLAITAVRPINEQLNLVLFYRNVWLDSNITASPIITGDQVTTYFAGVIYAF